MDASRAGSGSPEVPPPPQPSPPAQLQQQQQQHQQQQPPSLQRRADQQEQSGHAGQQGDVEEEEVGTSDDDDQADVDVDAKKPKKPKHIPPSYRQHDGVWFVTRNGKEETKLKSPPLRILLIQRKKLQQSMFRLTTLARSFGFPWNFGVISCVETSDVKGKLWPNADIALGAENEVLLESAQQFSTIMVAQMEVERAKESMTKIQDRVVRVAQRFATRFRMFPCTILKLSIIVSLAASCKGRAVSCKGGGEERNLTQGTSRQGARCDIARCNAI